LPDMFPEYVSPKVSGKRARVRSSLSLVKIQALLLINRRDLLGSGSEIETASSRTQRYGSLHDVRS